MAIPNTETLLPTLLSRFLDTRRLEMGLPAESELPFVVGPQADAAQYPRVLFIGAAFSCPHPRRQDLTVSVQYQVSYDASAPATENQVAALIRYCLADKAAFFAWLSELPEADRSGWVLRKYRVQDGGMAVEEQTRIRARSTDVLMHVRTDEMAPLPAGGDI